MLRGAFEDAADLSPTELRSAYREKLAATIEVEGRDAVAAESGVDEGVLAAIEAGESPELTLADAAAILAVDPERPDADAIAAEARDILLVGMTTAVLDVERLASALGGALEPKELQQKVEGRAPMTLREYALVHGYLAGATR
jgi:hypothetical protein